MKLPVLQHRPWASSALVVGLVALSNLGPVAAQQFADLTLGHDGYPDLSERCYDALNTTVQGCPGFVAANAVDIARLVSGQLEALCTSSCRSSLSSVRSVIASGCSADTDVVEFNRIVYPATYTIDRILHAYDVSCARDADTGVFCDEVYLDNLANGTSADECSDCSLGVGRILLNSPFGFDEGFAADFKSRTASCGAAGYAFTSPAPYAVSTLPPPPAATETGAACEAPYEVQPGDSCDSIATARGVSTHAVIRAGNAGPGCTNLAAGKKLCLPEPCTQYRVQWDDSCADVLAAVPGLQAQHLLTWNPNINPLCTNLGDMVSHLLCVSPPGRSLGDVTAITEAPPATTQPVPTAVPRPANAKAESHERCAGWYEIQAGDYCQLLSVRHAIELRDFFFLNPSVNDPDCDNLWLETSYCVKYVGDINTYPSYPYSTTPPYTLTAPTYVTTTRPPLETVAPSETPVVTHPLAAGSHGEAEGCLDFVQHIEVPVRKDHFQQPDVPPLTEIVNTCDFIVASAGVEFEDFVEWNPSLAGLELCKLQLSFRYCVDHEGFGKTLFNIHPHLHTDPRCRRRRRNPPPSKLHRSRNPRARHRLNMLLLHDCKRLQRRKLPLLRPRQVAQHHRRRPRRLEPLDRLRGRLRRRPLRQPRLRRRAPRVHRRLRRPAPRDAPRPHAGGHRRGVSVVLRRGRGRRVLGHRRHARYSAGRLV